MKSGNKVEKLAYCQRQIDRLVRWSNQDDDNAEFLKHLATWLELKKAVLNGRA